MVKILIFCVWLLTLVEAWHVGLLRGKIIAVDCMLDSEGMSMYYQAMLCRSGEEKAK